MKYCQWGLIILAALTFAACGNENNHPLNLRGDLIGVPTVIALRTVTQINEKAATPETPGILPLQLFTGPAQARSRWSRSTIRHPELNPRK